MGLFKQRHLGNGIPMSSPAWLQCFHDKAMQMELANTTVHFPNPGCPFSHIHLQSCPMNSLVYRLVNKTNSYHVSSSSSCSIRVLSSSSSHRVLHCHIFIYSHAPWIPLYWLPNLLPQLTIRQHGVTIIECTVMHVRELTIIQQQRV